MNRQLHVWPRDPVESGGAVELKATIEGGRGGRAELVYRLSPEHRAGLTASANPFVVATVFLAMQERSDVRVHGRVSPSLLRNLEEFQVAWSAWRPARYGRVAIAADEEREEAAAPTDAVVLAFSGGLDSCCSAWSHRQGTRGRRNQRIGAGLMAHGFDVPLDEEETFTRAAENSRRILASIETPLITVACNFRSLDGDRWEDSHATAIASCLHLFSPRFAGGMIASSHCYTTLRFPWGSNPLTDHLLGSASFPVSYDALEDSRNRKALSIADWPEAMARLRVCWEGELKDRNCGTCLRCVSTAVCFAVERVTPPAILGVASLDAALGDLPWHKIPPAAMARLGELLARARARGIADSWVEVLAAALQRRRWQDRWGRARDLAANFRGLHWLAR